MANLGTKSKKEKANSTIRKYNPSAIEKKWQKYWAKNKTYQPNLDSANSSTGSGRGKPFYNLMMFPYPSAEGMHMGNMYAFTGSDVYGRFMRMRGYDVFEPIGLDGFGIHSENYALKVGRHPKEQAEVSEKNFYRQLRATGNGFSWDSKVETYDPEYYKWTQWIFIQLFKAGLAFRKKASVNYCPSCKTVLADEQVIAGKCERCGIEVVKKDLEQWFFKITDYAERLLNNIKDLDWSEKVKIAQRLWIGRSEDTEIDFQVKDNDFKVKIITTRSDTLFGATFLVIAPEHALVQKLKPKIKNWDDVEIYIKTAQSKTDFEREQSKDKTGVVLKGISAINPVNNKEVSMYIADYVLATYGTGAIMAVPAHDDRDFEFAKKFGLPIIHVIEPPKMPNILRVYVDDQDRSDLAQELRNMGRPMEYWTPTLRRYDVDISESGEVAEKLEKAGVGSDDDLEEIKKGGSFALEFEPAGVDFGTVYTGDGLHINSDFINGLNNEEAIQKMTKWLSEREIGGKTVHYHLRDWLISRQRYWGPPIPLVFCENCAKKIKNRESRVKNRQNFKKGELENPGWIAVSEKDLPVLLPDVKDWKPTGKGTSPLATVESFVKTKCPNCGGPAQRETDVSDTFLDSAWYFFRYTSTEFKDKAFDKKRVEKWLPVDMYIGGAEHSVLHLLYSRFITMFFNDLGLISFEEPYIKFRAHGLLIKEGAKMSKSKGNVVIPDKYIRKFGADTLRLYLMFLGPFTAGGDFYDTGIEGMHRFVKRIWVLVTSKSSIDKTTKEGLRFLHKTIKKVTEDMEALRYNTAIASMMEYYNFLSKQQTVSKDEIKTLILLISPFAPHISEEMWSITGFKNSVHRAPWPSFSQEHLVEKSTNIIVQINGRTRDVLSFNTADINNKRLIENTARISKKAEKYISNRPIRKVVYVPGKVINFVIDNGNGRAV